MALFHTAEILTLQQLCVVQAKTR